MVITLTLQMREGGLCLPGCEAVVGAGCEPRMDPRAHIPKMLRVLLGLMGGCRPEHVGAQRRYIVTCAPRSSPSEAFSMW